MNLGLNDKYAFVTGGSHGIGRSIVLSLAKEGCDVAFCGRNLDRVNEVVEAAKNINKGNVSGVVSDITDPKCLETAIPAIGLAMRSKEIKLRAWARINGTREIARRQSAANTF